MFNEILEELFNRVGQKDKGLVKKLIGENGLSFKGKKILNVVGTNGKGSVSYYVFQHLTKHYNVGLFTSPHIMNVNERIRINADFIKDHELVHWYDKYKDEKIGYFSMMFLIALEHFKQKGVEILIIEAGIGGKEDITSFVKNNATALTSIGLDHSNYFNNDYRTTIEQKVGIANNGANIYYPKSINQIDIVKEESDKLELVQYVSEGGKTYKDTNKNLAKLILETEFATEPKHFRESIGRTQSIKRKGLDIIFDVAHNKDGIEASMKYLKSENIKIDQIVIAINQSKDIKDIENLFGDSELFFFKPQNDFHNISWATEIKDLNKHILENINKKILFIGSFKLVKPLMNAIKDILAIAYFFVLIYQFKPSNNQ